MVTTYVAWATARREQISDVVYSLLTVAHRIRSGQQCIDHLLSAGTLCPVAEARAEVCQK